MDMTSFLPAALWRRLFAGRLPADEGSIADRLDRVGHIELADEVAFFGATRSDGALRVAVFGEYNVGKSTLVNALLGRQLLAARLRPTTGVPAEVRAGTGRVRIATREGREVEATLADADRASSLDTEARARDEIDRLLIEVPSALLEAGLALIDTPGVLDAEAQTERARREVAAADVVVLVLRADHLLSRSERDYALEWLTRDLAKPVVPVVNFMGRVPEPERAELRALVAGFARELIPALPARWYEVDALPALRHRLGVKGAPAPGDGYDALHADLAALGPRRDEIKAQSRAGWQASWRRRARAANRGMLEQLEREAAELAAARTQAATRIGRRLDHLADDARSEKDRLLLHIARFRRAGAEAIIAALPGDAALVTGEARAEAARDAALRLARAQGSIDEAAGAALARLVADSAIVLEPLCVRELAALDIAPSAALESASDGAGLTWALGALGLTLWYGLAWKIAIPVAMVGWLVGRSAANVSQQIDEFRERLAANAESSLDRMSAMLIAGLDARAAELRLTLARRHAALAAPPPRAEELRIRRDLATVLGHE